MPRVQIIRDLRYTKWSESDARTCGYSRNSSAAKPMMSDQAPGLDMPAKFALLFYLGAGTWCSLALAAFLYSAA